LNAGVSRFTEQIRSILGLCSYWCKSHLLDKIQLLLETRLEATPAAC
jgi:hypothetical protein